MKVQNIHVAGKSARARLSTSVVKSHSLEISKLQQDMLIKISITQFLFALEVVLLETQSVNSIHELDWPAVEYFYKLVKKEYPSIILDRNKFVVFKKNYNNRKKLWLNLQQPLPREIESLKGLLRNLRDMSAEWKVKKECLSPSDNRCSGMGEPGDKLGGRYLSTKLDNVWTADVTSLGKLRLLLIMDLGPRQVIAHKLFEKSPLAVDVAKLLAAAFSARQPPNMFHSDSDGIFTGGSNHRSTTLLEREGILISRGNQKYRKHHNQVQERLHRTLKDLLARKLYDRMGKALQHTKEKAWCFLETMSLEEARELVTEVIEGYNSTFHRGVGASPNLIDTAIAVYGDGKNILARKGSVAGDKVEEFHSIVVSKYAGDWQRFFIDFYQKSMAEHKETQERIERSSAKLIAALEREKLGHRRRFSFFDERTFYFAVPASRDGKVFKLHFGRSREQEELEKRDRQARRRARTRKPVREALFVKEYRLSQSLLRGNNFETCRGRVGLLLLFLTGLRVRSLLLTTGGPKGRLSFLDEDNKALVYPGNSTAAEIRIPLPGEARELIAERSDDIRRLLAGRAPEDFVMSRTEGSPELLSVTNLTKRLNRVMRKLSEKTNKLFRTHSFRIGLTTSLASTAGLEIARGVIGHHDFRTTASYNRHVYTQRERRKALGAAYRRGAPRRRRKKDKGEMFAKKDSKMEQSPLFQSSPSGVALLLNKVISLPLEQQNKYKHRVFCLPNHESSTRIPPCQFFSC